MRRVSFQPWRKGLDVVEPVFLLIPFKDPSGHCCCLVVKGSVQIFPLLCLCPLIGRIGKQESHLSRLVCFVSSELQTMLTRINVSGLDKDDF